MSSLYDEDEQPGHLRELIREACARAFAEELAAHGVPDTIPIDCVPQWSAQLGDDDPREYRHGPIRIFGQFADRHDPAHVDVALADMARILDATVERDTIGDAVQGAIRTEVDGIAVEIWGTIGRA